jgi:hypothetical protein
MGFKAAQFGRIVPTFRRNVSLLPLTAEPKAKQSMKPSKKNEGNRAACCLLLVGSLLG